MKKIDKTSLPAIALAAALCAPAQAIDIVGSSTVYPFSTVAAELFVQNGGVAPKVESTGSGGGLKLFCAGKGEGTPDIANASRRIKKSEQDTCAENDVGDILEVKIGYDGIVVARSLEAKGNLELTRRQMFLALGRDIPDADGNLVKNPNSSWSDADASLPSGVIRVYGPPPTSGTRDAFAELVLEEGCASYPDLKAIKKEDSKRYKGVCHGVREDGAYIESGENDNLIIQKLVSNPDSLGIFGYSFLDENRDKVRGVPIEGVVPEFDAIADGSYPVSRPLYFYVKLAHYGQTPGLEEFVNFFVSEDVMGEDGELSGRGLIPLPDEEYSDFVEAARTRRPMPKL